MLVQKENSTPSPPSRTTPRLVCALVFAFACALGFGALAFAQARGAYESSPASEPAADGEGREVAAASFAPPSNDICGNALDFNPTGNGDYLSPLVSDVTDATSTGDPAAAPSCAFGGGPVSRSIWFRFTAPVTGPHIVSTCSDAPAGTTVTDTVLAVYATASGCSGPFTETVNGCDDDSCIFKDAQAEAVTTLIAGTTYYVVVWQFGTTPPTAGSTAVQVRVIPPSPVPSNDTCAAARVLTLDAPVTATLAGGADNYELSGSACFAGLGQTASAAAGREVLYSFSAPTAGSYSFRAQNLVTGGNPVLYVASTCPAATPGSPVTVDTCLAGSNRGASGNAFSSEEIMCLPLAASQQVFVYVDEAAMTITGGALRLEANRCAREVEPNNTPPTANAVSCGIEGSISSGGEADFFSLGAPAANSRLFALADGVAGSSTDFDMRVTTAADTLEFDDLDAAVPFGSLSPALAGTKLTGLPVYIRMSHHASVTVSEPYRLYTTIQPPSAAATTEVEPNGTIGQAQSGAATNNYFYGQLPGPPPSTDVDLYPFTAGGGQLVVLAVDGDPGYDGTAMNAALALLDSNGIILAQVNDPDAFSNLRTPVPASLTSSVPLAPAEALTYRITAPGTYYARVMAGNDQPDSTGFGDYLLSISKNCVTGGGGLSADVSVNMVDSPDPVQAGDILTYTLTVSNAGPADAFDVYATDTLPGNVTFVSTSGPCQEGASAVPQCTLGLVRADSSRQYTITVRARSCMGNGSLLNSAHVSASTPDTNAANNTATQSTSVTDPGTCDDGNICTANDHCSAGACLATPLTPSEATNLRVQANKTLLTWTAAPASTASDLARGRAGEFPVGTGAAETCVASSLAATSITDQTVPPASASFWYLVRGRNSCGPGPYGFASSGAPEVTSTCP